MSSPSKAKGTRMESAIVRAINEYAGYKVAERVALHGNKDHGDIRLDLGDMVLTIESKCSKTYPTESEFERFKQQTVDENENACQDGGVLIVNLPGKSVSRYECWMQFSTLCRLRARMVGLDLESLPEPFYTNSQRMLRMGESHWIMCRFSHFLSEYVGHYTDRQTTDWTEIDRQDY